MQPQSQGSAEKAASRIALRISAAAALAAALALIAFSMIRLNARAAALQDSLDTAFARVDSIQRSLERPAPAPKPAFSVASFELIYKKDDVGESYSGNAIIACDQPDVFLVILKTTLVSGGSAYTDAASYSLLIVQNGIGKYSTYDWGESGQLQRPRYEFLVAGYFQPEANSR